MFNFHPQRWTDDTVLWLKEKNTQQIKNLAKYLLIKVRHTIPTDYNAPA